MAKHTHRLQMLVPEYFHLQMKKLAQEKNESMAFLIRHAVELVYFSNFGLTDKTINRKFMEKNAL